MKFNTRTLTGTAIFASLVVVLDYTMKLSGFKISFPLLPDLKFDFTGIPIVLSLLFYGLTSATTTSAIAFLAIFARSGDAVSASMKALAEFSTILGLAIGLKFFKDSTRYNLPFSFASGIILRTITMFFANLSILPLYYIWMTFDKALFLSPYVAGFNIIYGFLSMFGGYLINKAVETKISYLIHTRLVTFNIS